MNVNIFTEWTSERVSTIAQVAAKHVYVHVVNYHCVQVHGLPLKKIHVLSYHQSWLVEGIFIALP